MFPSEGLASTLGSLDKIYRWINSGGKKKKRKEKVLLPKFVVIFCNSLSSQLVVDEILESFNSLDLKQLGPLYVNETVLEVKNCRSTNHSVDVRGECFEMIYVLLLSERMFHRLQELAHLTLNVI